MIILNQQYSLKAFVKVIIGSWLVGLLTISSCTFNNEQDFFRVPPCDSSRVDRDTINVNYNDLTYIFSDVCATCHYPNNPFQPNIVMNTYESVVLSVKTGRVIPAIQFTGRYQMPKDLPKLENCELQRIEVWIEKGMPKTSK